MHVWVGNSACKNIWETNANTVCISTRFKSWWTTACSAAIKKYRASKSLDNLRAWKRTHKSAKAKFFDNYIREIATENRHPWDLMK